MSKPTFSLLCLTLTLCALAVRVQAVSIPCNYVVRYENCPDAEQTVCSVYPGVCVSETCQPSEYYNGCYACSDPTVMAYSIGACGSDTGSGSNPTNTTNNTNSTNPSNPSNPNNGTNNTNSTNPSNPTDPNNGTNSTNGTGSNPGNGESNEESDIELINSGGSESLEAGEDASAYVPVESDLEDMEVDISDQELSRELEAEFQQQSVSSGSTNSSVTLRQSFYVVVYCDNVRPTSCTNDINPVCAISCQNGVCQKTVNNICLACADTNILSYSLGSCEVQNISCPTINFATDTTTCTSFYDPVCSYPSGCTSKSCATTVTNSCGACYTNRASYFTLGPC